jgi:hypothetical protein
MKASCGSSTSRRKWRHHVVSQQAGGNESTANWCRFWHSRPTVKKSRCNIANMYLKNFSVQYPCTSIMSCLNMWILDPCVIHLSCKLLGC